jgi:hypothetical protein
MRLADLALITAGRAVLSLAHHDNWRLVFSGEVDMRDPSEELLPYLLEVHRAVLEEKITLLEVDFSALTFMNSSGLKMLISWIMEIKDLPAETRYSLRVIHDPESVWQSSSLPVLRKLLPDHISLVGP